MKIFRDEILKNATFNNPTFIKYFTFRIAIHYKSAFESNKPNHDFGKIENAFPNIQILTQKTATQTTKIVLTNQAKIHKIEHSIKINIHLSIFCQSFQSMFFR
jgi:hypothetical protein